MQGIWKSVEKIGKKCGFVSENYNVYQKVRKSAILTQKCEIMDFDQIVHNNAVLLKWCSLVRFLPKSVGSHPHTFPDALTMIIFEWNGMSTSFNPLSFGPFTVRIRELLKFIQECSLTNHRQHFIGF